MFVRAAMLSCALAGMCAAQDQPVVRVDAVLLGTCTDAAAIDPVPGITVEALWDECVDPDDGWLHGLAVYRPLTGTGNWNYQLSPGLPWQVLFPGGHEDGVVVLGPEARLWFAPQPGYAGTATIETRAWDGSDGRVPGRYEVVDDPSSVGSAVSIGVIQAQWTVTDVNLGPPVCVEKPSVSGQLHVRCRIRGFPGAWQDAQGDPSWEAVQWQARWEREEADGSASVISDRSELDLGPELLGHRIRIRVVATDVHGASTSAETPWAEVTENTAPVFVGMLEQVAHTDPDVVPDGIDLAGVLASSVSDDDGPNYALAIVDATGGGRWQRKPHSLTPIGWDGYEDIPAFSASQSWALGPRFWSPASSSDLPPWEGSTLDDDAPMIGVTLRLQGDDIRFLPDPGWQGVAVLTVRAWDGKTLGNLTPEAVGNLSVDTFEVRWRVGNNPPTCITPIGISGEVLPGGMLESTEGVWEDVEDRIIVAPLARYWEILDAGRVIHSVSSDSFQIVREFAGLSLRLRETATDSDGANATVTTTEIVLPSDQPPICVQVPVLHGVVDIGATMTCDTGLWVDDYDVASMIQACFWEARRDGEVRTLPSADSMEIADDLGGWEIRVVVTVTDAGGQVSQAASAWSLVPQSHRSDEDAAGTDADAASAESAASCGVGAGMALLLLPILVMGLRRRCTY